MMQTIINGILQSCSSIVAIWSMLIIRIKSHLVLNWSKQLEKCPIKKGKLFVEKVHTIPVSQRHQLQTEWWLYTMKKSVQSEMPLLKYFDICLSYTFFHINFLFMSIHISFMASIFFIFFSRYCVMKWSFSVLQSIPLNTLLLVFTILVFMWISQVEPKKRERNKKKIDKREHFMDLWSQFQTVRLFASTIHLMVKLNAKCKNKKKWKKADKKYSAIELRNQKSTWNSKIKTETRFANKNTNEIT